MATTTLTDLITKVRRKAGIEESAYVSAAQNTITDAFITDEINSAGSYLHQRLTNTDENWFTRKAQIVVDAGSWTANLPDDCYRIRTVDKMYGNDGYRPVDEFDSLSQRTELRGIYGYPRIVTDMPRYELAGITADAPGGVIEFQPTSVAPGTYLVTYVPQYENLTNGSDAVTFPMNWHDYVVTYAAIQCKAKVYLPTDEEKETLARLEVMILRGAVRRGQPRRMLNLRNRRRWP